MLSVLWGPDNGLGAGCSGGGIWRARFGTWSLELGAWTWREELEPSVGTALPHRSVLSLSQDVEDFFYGKSGVTKVNLICQEKKRIFLFFLQLCAYKEIVVLQLRYVCVANIPVTMLPTMHTQLHMKPNKCNQCDYDSLSKEVH